MAQNVESRITDRFSLLSYRPVTYFKDVIIESFCGFLLPYILLEGYRLDSDNINVVSYTAHKL